MSAVPHLDLITEPLEAGALVRAAGEIDIANADLLERELDALRVEGRPTLLDLREVRFLDSTGLRVLLRAAHKSAEGDWKFFIVALSAAARRVIELTGMERQLPLLENGQPERVNGRPG